MHITKAYSLMNFNKYKQSLIKVKIFPSPLKVPLCHFPFNTLFLTTAVCFLLPQIRFAYSWTLYKWNYTVYTFMSSFFFAQQLFWDSPMILCSLVVHSLSLLVIFHRMDISQCIYSPVNEHLGFFQFGSIRKYTTLNTTLK